MGWQKDTGVNDAGYTMRLVLLLLLVTSSSSATFQEIYDVRLEDEPGIWRGIPTVNLENQTNLPICANDTYWSSDIAHKICQYYGFEGSMVIQITDVVSPGFEEGYALCEIETSDTDSRLPLACEFTDTCQSIPTISCILPGYQGCYTQTDISPVFTDGDRADIGDQQLDIQTCADACFNTTYIGLINGQDCICGSVLGDQDDAGVCNVTCEGDNLQECGGQNATSVYSASVIGQCGTSGVVEVTPDQPYYITSPNFPDIYEGNDSCTWILAISVDMLHDLEIITTYDFVVNGTTEHLQVSSESGIVEQTTAGSSGVMVLSETPYRALEDNITVSFTPSDVGNGTSFIMKFSLTSNPMYITTELPTESTTSKAGQTINLSKLAISAAVGVILVVVLLI